MRKNVLISTTRQWNPGDEFIMHGSLNIFHELFGDQINPIIFNRNPDIRGGSKWRNKSRRRDSTIAWDLLNFRGKGIIQETFRIGHYDNSYKDDMDPDNIDFALFAGSPEWFNNRLLPMYQTIEKANIPTFFLGLGAGDRSEFSAADQIVRRTLKAAKIITTRDYVTESLLNEYGARYMPCPAFLSAKKCRVVKAVNRIGLIYATDYTVHGNKVSPEMHKYIVMLYAELSKIFCVGLICHYIDELDQARKELPGIDLFYSYDSKDYIDIYDHFDLIVGGRVHGIGLGCSLGVPGIMIKHDARSSTTDGFLASSVMVDTPLEQVIHHIQTMICDISDYSEKIIEHKKEVMEQYVSLLRPLCFPQS
ncbi:MAG: polysaccharide pyruvyl transferase family protein [Aminipila sp.]